MNSFIQVLAQAAPGVPVSVPEMPVWVTLILTPLAVWFGAKVWPVITERWKVKDERELAAEQEERDFRKQLAEREVRAQELTAESIHGIRQVLGVMQFQIAEIQRHVGIKSEVQRLTPPNVIEGGKQ